MGKRRVEARKIVAGVVLGLIILGTAWAAVQIAGGAAPADGGGKMAAEGQLQSAKFVIVYDNVAADDRFRADWGFACVVFPSSGPPGIFDTGTDPAILAHNLQAARIDASEFAWCVLSHAHADHYGGLEAVLRSGLAVYGFAGFPRRVVEAVQRSGARWIQVEGPREIAPGICTTGPVSGPVVEQALVVRTLEGNAVITGCSHPGVVKLVREAARAFGPVRMVMGGFHLGGASRRAIERIVDELVSLGVKRAGALHCSGAVAQEIFAERFGEKYIKGGAGAVVTFP